MHCEDFSIKTSIHIIPILEGHAFGWNAFDFSKKLGTVHSQLGFLFRNNASVWLLRDLKALSDAFVSVLGSLSDARRCVETAFKVECC